METFSLKAREAMEKEEWDTALGHYLGLAKLRPQTSVQTQVSLCVQGYLQTVTDRSHAQTVVNLALHVYPASADIRNVWGQWLFAHGHITDAAEEFVQILKNEEDSETMDSSRARQNLANLGTHLLDQWHFRMLNDHCRNTQYHTVIQHAVQERLELNGHCRVMDVGSGSGLLSVMAAKAGATKVYGVEQDAFMCVLATNVLSQNGLRQSDVSIVAQTFSQMHLSDIGEKVDIVVTELMDAGFFGESIVSTLLDAKKRFLTADGIIIPKNASVMAAIVECPAILRNSVYCPSYAEGDNGSPVAFLSTLCKQRVSSDVNEPYTSEVLSELEGGYRFLSDPVMVCSVDFNCEKDLLSLIEGKRSHLPVKISCNGVAHAVVCWFRVDLGFDVHLDSGPDMGTNWEQAVFPIANRCPLNQHDTVSLDIHIKDNWFSCHLKMLEDSKMTSDYQCIDYLDSISIGLLNDRALHCAISLSLDTLNRRNSITALLYVCLTPYLLPTLLEIASSCAVTVLLLEPLSTGWSTLLDMCDREDKLTVTMDECDMGERSWDVVVCQPVLSNGLLSGQLLAQMAIQRTISRPSTVLLSKLVVNVALIESDELMVRTGVRTEETEGVRLQKAFEAFWVKVHQDVQLSTLEHRKLSDDQQLMTLNLEEPLETETESLPKFVRQTALVDVRVKKEGRADGLLLWLQLCLPDRVISTADDSNQFRVSVHMFSNHRLHVVAGQILSFHCFLDNGQFTVTLRSVS